MALPTAEHAGPAQPQKPTPGMVQQGAHGAKAAATPQLDPVLVEGIDPVLLHRLYPTADSIADVGARALEQGKQTAADGGKLQAAQQAKPEMPHHPPGDATATPGTKP